MLILENIVVAVCAFTKLCDMFHNYIYKCGLFQDKLAASSEGNVDVATERVQLPQMTVIRIAIVALDTEDPRLRLLRPPCTSVTPCI